MPPLKKPAAAKKKPACTEIVPYGKSEKDDQEEPEEEEQEEEEQDGKEEDEKEEQKDKTPACHQGFRKQLYRTTTSSSRRQPARSLAWSRWTRR